MPPHSAPDLGPDSALGDALARLASALDGLETGATLGAERRRGRVSAEAELTLMRDDRSRLAGDLDEALDRAAALEEVAAALGPRLARAEAGVRAVLDGLAAGEAAGDEALPADPAPGEPAPGDAAPRGA